MKRKKKINKWILDPELIMPDTRIKIETILAKFKMLGSHINN